MFKLDERLNHDTYALGDLPLCRVLLMNDNRFPWLILVPRQSGISEVFELDATQQQQLWQEAAQTAEALKRLSGADKMNIATLGNVVSQLHIHVVARRQTDIAWPAPVWGNGQAQPYDKEQIQQLRKQLCTNLGNDFSAVVAAHD